MKKIRDASTVSECLAAVEGVSDFVLLYESFVKSHTRNYKISGFKWKENV